MNEVHPDDLVVARTALVIGGYTARRHEAYIRHCLADPRGIVDDPFITRLSGCGSHTAMPSRSDLANATQTRVTWVTACIRDAARSPEQLAICEALIAELLL